MKITKENLDIISITETFAHLSLLKTWYVTLPYLTALCGVLEVVE